MASESLLQAIHPHDDGLRCANCDRLIREIQTAYSSNNLEYFCSMPCAWEHKAKQVIEHKNMKGGN